tara:strand:+ start:109 stop:1113 length:1005 start_codon:yes stop_codon:yes gene_type:complete
MVKNILVVGGSGYIGRVLIEDLIKEQNKIINLDLKIYPDQKDKSLKNYQNENFINLDLRDTKSIKNYLSSVNSVIILAGLVGEHITKKYPLLSETINEKGITDLIDECDNYKNIKNLIFVSTCSNYGITKNQTLVSEDHELKPLSPYAKAKVKIEKYILDKKKTLYSPTILRFATAFGYSPRMRYDLTINHFCYSMFKEKKIEVYDPDTWRPYCHVKDFSRLIKKILISERNKIYKKVFNAGSNSNNFTKSGIVNLISKRLPDAKVLLKKGGVDKRDYRVSFEKIERELGFKAKFSVEDGINEILNILRDDKMKFLIEDSTKTRGNFQILDHVK